MKAAFGEHVTVTMDGHVAVITLDRPPHNFLSVEFASDLADACEAIDSEPMARAIVLQSEGRSFSAGVDFSSSSVRPASPEAVTRGLYAQAARLFSVRKPIVAAIQGAAIGGGLGLALVADFRVVSPEARFAANFVKLGFHPGFGITYALPRLIGEQKAALLMLTGRRINGQEALDWGLADELVVGDQLRAAALRLASEIAENAPLAVVATRKTLREGLSAAIRTRTDIELREQTNLRGTEDFQEGLRSVGERRPGNFVGR